MYINTNNFSIIRINNKNIAIEVINIRKIVIIFLLIFSITSAVYGTEEIIASQLDSLNLSSFVKEGEKYSKDVFKNIDINKLLSSAISGNIDNSLIFKSIFGIFGKEITSSIKLIGEILVIIVIHSILKSIVESLGNETTLNITYYVEYILIITLIMSNFSNLIAGVENSIINMVSFLNTLVPILIALIISTGSTISAGVIQPILLFSIIFIGNIISSLIIPIVVISTVMGVISNISDRIQIEKISKFLQSSTLWLLGVITTVFVSALSLEGNLTSSIDGVAIKGIKAATSGLIPVVGKTLGDSISTVLGCTSIIKNAVGFVGIIVLIGICAVPIIRLTVLTLLYSFTAAISQPLADKHIVNVLEQMSSSFKFLLGVMFFIASLFIIGIAITLKISNVSF